MPYFHSHPMRFKRISSNTIEFHGNGVPDHAILSHTRGTKEISFRDLVKIDSK